MLNKYELIICEKPTQAKKVAEALADKKAKKSMNGKIAYYELEHNKKPIVVVCAVGHLFNLAEKDKKAWAYPIFNYEWKLSYSTSKAAAFTKPYVDTIKKLAKNADSFTVATDFDNEGSVIGFNVIQFLCGKQDGKRMKFSTLTKDELVYSYENAMKHLDFPQIEAGITRHSLDWLFGINLSRALTLSIKNATDTFSLLSTGRVQGPTLKVLYDKEKEIEAFKSEPYWEIQADLQVKKDSLEAWHIEGRIFDNQRAENIVKNCKDKEAVVTKISTKEFKHKPPVPPDLTSLQIEAYSVLGLSPQATLDIAQTLYTDGLISYPRTGSNQLPDSIGYKKIIEKLSKIFLNKKELKPKNGKKQDAAHPAIYPTGELPKKLEGKAHGLYELITRRFFSTFCEDATRETLNIYLDIGKEKFLVKGTKTKFRGWYDLYGRFLKLSEDELPIVKEKDILKVYKIIKHDKETKPPSRYTEASLVKEMENFGIGTKATRSAIIQNLYDRKYIDGKPIGVTNLGKVTVDTLSKYSPEILDVKLTRDFEEEMEAIEANKKKSSEVLDHAKEFLDKTLTKFKKSEKKIGEALGVAAKETRDKESFISKCPKCGKGDLQIRRGKYGMFAACNRYEEGCETTFALAKNALIRGADKECEICKYPMVLVIKARKRPQENCINPECPKKKEEEAKLKKLVDGKTCPHCGSQLVVKNGFYGAFLSCPGYPKCKYIEKMPKFE